MTLLLKETKQTPHPLEEILGFSLPPPGSPLRLRGRNYSMHGGILRAWGLVDRRLSDTSSFYDRHWKTPGAYDGEASDRFQREVFADMFPIEDRPEIPDSSRVLDVGCGSGVAGRAFFHSNFSSLTYIGLDMSGAIDQARDDFERHDLPVGLVQCEAEAMPFADASFDVVFCPGVLHYSLDMHVTIQECRRVLKKEGLFITWVYTEQKPIRKLTDDYLRSVISNMPPEAGFEATKALTMLGIALGQIEEPLVIPHDIDCLGIKAGRYNLQRFFYYHIMKLFYNAELPLVRHVVNNWNAYSPKHVTFLPAQKIREYLDDFEPILWN